MALQSGIEQLLNLFTISYHSYPEFITKSPHNAIDIGENNYYNRDYNNRDYNNYDYKMSCQRKGRWF